MVYTINPLEDPRWAEFVQRHPRASVFHTPGSLEALRRTYGHEPAQSFYCNAVDLDAELTEIFLRCHKESTYGKLRRAERQGLTCEEGRSEELVQKFYQLLLRTRRRLRLPPHPRDWFRNLVD